MDELTAAVPGADEAGFRAWVAVRREPLRRSAYLICLDWHLADDLVQDALARTYARWPRVARHGNPEAYVRRAILNGYLDLRRRPWRRVRLDADLPETAADVATAAALEAVEGTSERARLVSALGRLGPGQRAVLVLRFFEDLSVEQTAELLGCTTGTVKSQTARGLERLREQLGHDRLALADSRTTDSLGSQP